MPPLNLFVPKFLGLNAGANVCNFKISEVTNVLVKKLSCNVKTRYCFISPHDRLIIPVNLLEPMSMCSSLHTNDESKNNTSTSALPANPLPFKLKEINFFQQFQILYSAIE